MHRNHALHTRTWLMLFSLLLFAFTPGARATSVLPLNLEQLSQQASTIIYARVVANRVEKDSASGQAATYTDFEVLETIKGKTGATHTIKQLGGRLPGSAYSLRVHGVPSFAVGKEYVVFLPRPSQWGFCSPLGLYQGSFIVQEINGEKVISNGRNYSTAATPASSSAAKLSKTANAAAGSQTPVVSLPLATNPNRPSQANLSDFIQTVRVLATEH